MALSKYVVDEDGNATVVPMTPEEEAEFLATLPPAGPMVPAKISDRQFYQQLAVEGTITQEEALAAVMVGTLPASLVAIISQYPAQQQFNARMLLCGATEFLRDHPMTKAIGAARNKTPADIDAFFLAASHL